MERLWSPWRSHYVDDVDHRSGKECFLCSAAACTTPDVNHLVVAVYHHCVVLLNKYPYNAGHVLIAPKDHQGDLLALGREAQAEIQQAQGDAIRVLTSTIQPHGYNIGLNLGQAAGAGVPDHLHWHVVPRWEGDANFMPTTADVRVVSHAIQDLWAQISEAFKVVQHT